MLATARSYVELRILATAITEAASLTAARRHYRRLLRLARTEAERDMVNRTFALQKFYLTEAKEWR